MADDTQGDLLLEALLGEIMKIKRVYDANTPPRVITQYEAVANAINGQTCLRTDYTYVSTTTNLDAMKESISTWQSAWDI